MRLSNGESEVRGAYLEWEAYLLNPRMRRTGQSISWLGDNRERPTERPTSLEIAQLAAQGQYSFQAARDFALFRLWYDFEADGTTLRSASLGYYAIELEDAYELDEIGAEVLGLVGDDRICRWLRIDYDPLSARGVLHSACHLHLGGIHGSRVVVDAVPSPAQFLEFVIAICYPDDYKTHRLNAAGALVNQAKLQAMKGTSLPVIRHSEEELVLQVAVP